MVTIADMVASAQRSTYVARAIQAIAGELAAEWPFAPIRTASAVFSAYGTNAKADPSGAATPAVGRSTRSKTQELKQIQTIDSRTAGHQRLNRSSEVLCDTSLAADVAE